MACRFMDGFDYYATGDLSRKWTVAGTPVVQNTTIRNGINAAEMNSTTDTLTQTIDDQASWVIGFGFRINNISATNIILDIMDAGTIQVSLRLNADGTLEILRSGTTSVTGGLSTLALSTNIWYYIEVKVTIADSIGANTCKVRVNGTDWLTVATGQDLKATANATANGIKFKNGRSTTTLQVDDIYIFDGTGSDNNDFAGDSKVIALHPNANGAVSDFTGSDADSTDNYLHVDETDTDDDTSYVESSTATDVDLYNFDDLPEVPDAIHAVQVNFVAKKDDAGARTMRAVTRPVSTQFFGDIESPSDGAYLNFSKVYDLNPETSAIWTRSLLEATEFGVEIQA